MPACALGAGTAARNAEAVSTQPDAVEIGAEYQLARVDRVQDRQVKVNPFATSQVNVQVRVDLAVVGQVDADVPGAVQVRMFQKVQSQLFRSLLLLFKTQGPALAAQMLAKFGAGQGVQNKASRAAVIGCSP